MTPISQRTFIWVLIVSVLLVAAMMMVAKAENRIYQAPAGYPPRFDYGALGWEYRQGLPNYPDPPGYHGEPVGVPPLTREQERDTILQMQKNFCVKYRDDPNCWQGK